MRTSVVVCIALALVLALLPADALAAKPPGAPTDVRIQPLDDAANLVTWSSGGSGSTPLVGYHVWRAAAALNPQSNWIYLGFTEDTWFEDSSFGISDNIAVGYSIVAENSDGLQAEAQAHAYLRLPPRMNGLAAAPAPAAAATLQLHELAAGAGTIGPKCFLIQTDGVPPTNVYIDAPCVFNDVASLLPILGPELSCLFYEVWQITRLDLGGASPGGSSTSGGSGDCSGDAQLAL